MSALSRLVAFVRHEPAVLISLAGVAVTVATDFGFALSASQVAGIDAAVGALTGLLIRSQVTPVVKEVAAPAAPVVAPPAATPPTTG